MEREKMKNKKKPRLLFFHLYGYAGESVLQGTSSFGRKTGAEETDIAVPSAVVSRRHGEFTEIQGQWFYRDLGSSNGTWINGKRCEEPHLLKEGDILAVIPRRGENPKPEFKMVFLRKEARPWRKTDLTKENLKIEGASFYKENNDLFVINQGEENHVRVNGLPVLGRVRLEPMDLIQAGNTWFFCQGDSLWTEEERTWKGEGRKLVVDIQEKAVWTGFQKKTLLKDIRLTIDPGEFVLILGGSGAGKTTFMNSVMGYEKATGCVRYGELDLYEEYEKLKYRIGFVPQQDLIRLQDTVFHTLYSAVQMKMPAGASREDREERTQWILKLMGLEKERDTLAGNLSGGQRKRLSIAVELAGNPELFFLDEPDSGLDGIMARGLMEKLRAIADMGKMVMVISHSPDRTAELFTKVLVLAKSQRDNSGHLVFYGGIQEAKTFFRAESLEEIVQRVNRPEEGGQGLADEYIEKRAKEGQV